MQYICDCANCLYQEVQVSITCKPLFTATVHDMQTHLTRQGKVNNYA